MKRRMNVPLRVAAVTASAALVTMSVGAPALAAEGDIEVVNTETVKVYTDATGAVDSMRIYEQISLTGDGEVDLRNPIATDGLRNLDGFGGYSVEDGEQVASVSVDGERRLRSVSDYDGELPLDIQVRYFLDGEPIEPGDVVGEDGELEVRYTVKNVTGAPQEVTIDDGSGGTVTRTVEVPIPMVGSLTVTTPPNFTDVRSDQANLAGDGKGGTKLSFTMTLFPPIGSDTAEFGYTANISDGVIPRAAITALPVNPLESPSFASAGESYKGGADTGTELAAGASEIDANLLKLRDGAGELLAGLIQLRDGAQELQAGLAGEAAPGAAQLAAGATELSGGIGQLDAGAGQLSAGASELSAGAGRLGAGINLVDDGAQQLAAGGRELSAGTSQLAAGTRRLSAGTRQVDQGAKELDAGAQQLAGGAGALADGLTEAGSKAPALIDGLEQVQDGLELVDGGLTTMYSGIGELPTKAGPLYDGIGLLRDGIGTLADDDSLLGGLQALSGKFTEVSDSVGQINSGVVCADLLVKHVLSGVPAPPACYSAKLFPEGAPTLTPLADVPAATVLTNASGALATVSGGLGAVQSGLTSMDPEAPGLALGVAKLQCGLDNQVFANTVLDAVCLDPETGLRPNGLLQGINLLGGGISQLVSGVVQQVQGGIGAVDDDPADKTLRGGVNGLQAGVAEIQAGGETLLEGMAQLAAGAGQLDEGALALALGTGQLSAGTGELASGAGELRAGASELNAGAGQLAAGAGELAGGTGQLAAGAPELVDGAGRLSAGAGELAAGTGKAADGANQIADGANELASGLGDAADGSGRLADGLATAADGAPALEDGAQRLSDEGTSKLVEAGESTAQNYGEMYATLEAGAERAQTEKMVFGAPENAMGLAAYSFEIMGEDGEGSRNVARGLGGLAVLAAGAAAFGLRRKLI